MVFTRKLLLNLPAAYTVVDLEGFLQEQKTQY